MTRRPSAFVALVLVSAWAFAPPPAMAEALPQSGNAVFDRTVELVNEHYFSTAALPAFNEAAALAAVQMPDLKDADPVVVSDAVAFLLGSLNASHTGRFTPDQVDYYELADVFRFALRRDMRRLFPPRGVVTYAGIGIASRTIDGRRFVTDVYDGGPAAKAGLMTGDEIISVDGEPFAELGSFRGKAGKSAQLMVRRAPGAAPIAIDVAVEQIQPGALFAKAIADSVRRVDQGGFRIGTIHLWTYTAPGVTQILFDALGKGRSQGCRRSGARPQEQMGRCTGGGGRDLRRRCCRHGVGKPRPVAQHRQLSLAQAGGGDHRRRHAQRHGDACLFAEEERRAAGRRADRRRRAGRHGLSCCPTTAFWNWRSPTCWSTAGGWRPIRSLPDVLGALRCALRRRLRSAGRRRPRRPDGRSSLSDMGAGWAN